MNALGPPKRKRGVGTALQTAELLRAYSVLGFLQPAKSAARRCVACGCRVTNGNLGGYNGRSALSGSLWCCDCADGRGTS
jgi:hypothetical protein